MHAINLEPLSRLEQFGQPPVIDSTFAEEAIGFILKQIDRNLEAFTHQFPAPASENLIYPGIDNVEWTSSFWTGMLWLAYEYTGDDKYRHVAESQLHGYKERVQKRIETNTHDIGFLYSLSCVAAYKLTGNEEAKQTALLAADLLMERYFDKAGIVQAWGELSDPEQQGRMIIDCNLNLPLLYWATEVSGEPRYAEAARSHVKQAAAYIVRDDASTYHTYYMDVKTGLPRFGRTHQGYADDTCWSRGQAWGISGFPLSYLYTGDTELLELTKKLSNYFLNRLPDDLICYWDLIFLEGKEQERDSSAAAIAACGLLELSKQLPLLDPSKNVYENAALHILKSLHENYTAKNYPESNGVLIHAVYNKPRGMGINECNIWGDYFYFEALIRIEKDWKPYW
ncbi:glycoside hydrolase family 88 protein [Paenibacillus sp. V4I5]|uniref:glycoside hydrolase family 88 protein n=1 Tax=Paenibacillus sp. V4I5 TaxID=3042306 RepID=UPI00278D4D2E|nr:unsaturated chondroitin disaccharide hydrolase [Paenibacillus sp. V4I5]